LLQGILALKYLLDTNAWSGFFQGQAGFGIRAKRIMSDSPVDCCISIASIWEASIKIGIGKLKLPYDLEEDLPGLVSQSGFGILPITLAEAAGVGNLAQIHGDPFDRIMVSQARLNGLKIISRDPVFESYGISRIW
jgi:PIN domain nuclease of toxin-antitoxin system